MKVKIKSPKNLLNPKNIIAIELYFILFERWIVQHGVTPSIIYVLDILNCILLLWLIKTEEWKKHLKLILVYAIWVVLSMLIAGVYYSEWGGNVFSTMIEIRNIVRFPIFFISCVAFMKYEDCQKIFKVLLAFFFINNMFIVYQYFTFHPAGVWTRGDMLNGLFGTETGGNTFVNIILVVTTIYILTMWSEKQVKVRILLSTVAFSVLIAGLIELKAYFVELLMIYLLYWIMKGKTKREIRTNVLIVLVVIGVSAAALSVMFREYPWFRETMSLSGMLEQLVGNGYTGSGDLNRFTGIFTIAKNFFKEDITQILFGIGIGNSSNFSAFSSSRLFYLQYAYSHYDWFSATYVFVESGAIGLGLYLYTFIYFFTRKKKNEIFAFASKTMCILAIFLVFYGESLKTDAGYFVYFMIASGFVYKTKNTEEIFTQVADNANRAQD